MFCVKKPNIILMELLLELSIVVIEDSEDGKRTVCKKCARKIGHSTRRKTFIASSAPGHKHLRQPVLVVQFLFKASDLATKSDSKGKQHL